MHLSLIHIWEDSVDDNYEYQMNHTIIKMSKEMNKILKNFETYQLEDKKLQQIMKDLTTDSKNELCKFYKCINDKLYRKGKGRWKLYVPESVTGRLIGEIHTMYGHVGSKKCIKLLQEHFTFDRMTKRVQGYVKTCDKCQRCKAVSYTHLEIKFNGDVTVHALVDTGSAINGLAEEWFNRNKQRLRPYEELCMNNTLIVSAVGGKTKLIRKQIMCEIFIDNVRLCFPSDTKFN